MAAKKIDVKCFLKELDYRLNVHNQYKLSSQKLIIEPLTCNKLATLCGVTPATISNLNTDSKFSLCFDIASEIFYHYEDLFISMNRNLVSSFLNDNSECDPYPFVYTREKILRDLMDCIK